MGVDKARKCRRISPVKCIREDGEPSFFREETGGRSNCYFQYTDNWQVSKPKISIGDMLGEDFTLDQAWQGYICPHGKELTCHAHNQRNRHRLYDIYHARPEDCAEFPVRARCLSKSTTMRRYLSVQVDEPEPNVLDKMKAKIDTPQGKQIYARRLGIVEPVFTNIWVHKCRNRFTLRSKSKVDVQWRWFALVHNIGKICVFGAL